jgi:protein required for attachment to host cells
MTDTWILVADGRSARIFTAPADLSEFNLHAEHKNKHHAGEHRGRPDEGGAHHTEELAFAQELAHELTRAVIAHEVRDLVLVAPTRFLSDIASSVSASAASHITAKVAKDYTKLEQHALAERLREVLAGNHEAH